MADSMACDSPSINETVRLFSTGVKLTENALIADMLTGFRVNCGAPWRDEGRFRRRF